MSTQLENNKALVRRFFGRDVLICDRDAAENRVIFLGRVDQRVGWGPMGGGSSLPAPSNQSDSQTLGQVIPSVVQVIVP